MGWKEGGNDFLHEGWCVVRWKEGGIDNLREGWCVGRCEVMVSSMKGSCGVEGGQ